MTTTTPHNGRLGNQIIRNLAVSIIAKRFNLRVNYSSYEQIQRLGINMFIGDNMYPNTIMLTDENYFTILSQPSLNANLESNNNYFQTVEITNHLFDYLHNENVKHDIIQHNKFRDRYTNNNDTVIHIRLSDVAKYTPGLDYYNKAISKITTNKIYICTDEPTHHIVKTIISTHPNVILINCDEITTIQFASTCKNVILSHGSFSAVIGYLSFYSDVYYPAYESNKIWYGDMFSVNGWNKIE
jgi:hypothetical protein